MSTIAHFFDGQSLLWVKLKNHKFGNSFGEHEAEQIIGLLDEYRDNARGLVFSSEGKNIFCSGGNLKKYAKMTKSEGIKTNKIIAKTLKTLSKWPHPTACFVEGDCLGGGVEVLSAFDYVVATPASFFGIWQRKISLTFGWGGGERLIGRVSKSTLKKWSLEAKSFCAYEALNGGLIDGVVDSNKIKEHCGAWLQRQLKLPIKPIQPIKENLFDGGREVFESLWMNEEHEFILKKYR